MTSFNNYFDLILSTTLASDSQFPQMPIIYVTQKKYDYKVLNMSFFFLPRKELLQKEA